MVIITKSLLKHKLNKGGTGRCLWCDTQSTVKFPDDIYFNQISEDLTYISINYRNCDHIVPIGHFKDFKITTFQELHDGYMNEYKQTGNLLLYKKAKEMLKIASGEIELEF